MSKFAQISEKFSVLMAHPEARRSLGFLGRLVESAVAADLLNSGTGAIAEVVYWRERGREADFGVRVGKRVAAIEVKSGTAKGALPGMDAFSRAICPRRTLLAGGDGIPLETLFRTPTLELASG